jgi:hypothetical protein
MDQRERGTDLVEVIRAALDSLKSSLWTALPAIIESYDPDKLTVTCQVSTKVSLRQSNGVFIWVDVPLLVDVPVVFPSGGGFLVTWPLDQGDEVLVVFASRCIDGWWAHGGVQLPSELRFNDLSDGFALPGPRSVPRLVSNVSTTSIQIRNEAGTAFIELAAGGVVNIKAPGGVNILEGALNVDHEVTAQVLGVPIPLSTHLHGGVTVGGADTGVPIP